MKKQFLEAGKIVRTHGVRGDLVVECWADSPEFVKKLKRLYFDEGKTDAGLLSSRVHKGRLLVKLQGVDTVEQGDALRGRVLYLDRNDVTLPEGEFFLQDIIGLKAVDGETGQEYGVLAEVLPGVANGIYRIVNGDKEYLFPAVPHMVKKIDPEAGVIQLLPIPGIFDDGGRRPECASTSSPCSRRCWPPPWTTASSAGPGRRASAGLLPPAP